VLGLVLGLVVGDRTDLFDSVRDPDAGTRPAAMTIGAITQARDTASTGWDFELPVLNQSDSVIDVDLLGFEGVTSPFTSARARQIAPRAWRVIKFSAPANCDDPVSSAVSSVRLRVRGGPGGRDDVTKALPGEGRALVDYDRAVCGSGIRVLPADLAGVWIIERAYGPNMDLTGVQLMRFTREGDYVADPEGRLLSGESAVRGKWRLRGELLTISVQNSFGCGAGAEQTWRLTVDATYRLSMVWLRGDCPEGQEGNIWILRRVLSDGGLPAVR
jgi:hypothetical protein